VKVLREDFRADYIIHINAPHLPHLNMSFTAFDKEREGVLEMEKLYNDM